MSLFKKGSILTVLMLLCSSLTSISSFASEEPILENVLATEKVEGFSTKVDLDEYVVSKDFDLEDEVENMPSIDKMTTEGKELFDSIVEEQVALAGLENEEEEEKLFANAMVDFFDENQKHIMIIHWHKLS